MPDVAPLNINFLRIRRKQLAKLQQFDKSLFRIMLGIVAVAVLMASGMLVYWQYERFRLVDLKEKQAIQERIIVQGREDETAYQLYTKRLDSLAVILETRSSKKDALDFLSLIAQSTISFDTIQYDDKTKLLTFRVDADNVFAVERFLERLRSAEIAPYISKVDVSDIRRDEAARYLMEVAVTLGVRS